MIEFDSQGDIRFNQTTKKIEIYGKPIESWHEFVTRLDVQHEIEMNIRECKEVFTYLAMKNKYTESPNHWNHFRKT